jgi:hypothetical protein
MMMARFRLVGFVVCVGVAAAHVVAETSMAQLVASVDQVDFVRDVQPILRANCYKCHGSEKQKGLLRWDSKESAVVHGGQSGQELIPGKSGDSRIIRRVIGVGGEDRMPLNGPALSAAEIGVLKKWVDQGAKWPDGASVKDAKVERHWAYVKPVRAALPAVRNKDWCRNGIDYFVLAQLESQGFKPAPRAEKAVLLRRVYLDLIGLPPTVKEVEEFVNDSSPDAYEKVVDRLLAGKHFGERAATRWLDLARYADSNGYEKDRRRSMWPYRDWVINAFNANMGFDQFTVEQLAGDLLPNASDQQRIATGFNRNTMLNEEGGVDPDEYLYYANVDRVNTTATAWLGATLGCAQCHNHKYDPYTMRDFYSFLAYFNGTAVETSRRTGSDPTDVSARVTVSTPDLVALQNQASSLRAELDRPTDALAAAQVKWELKQRDATWTVLEPGEMKAPEGMTLTRQSDGSILAAGSGTSGDLCTITASTQMTGISAVRLDVLGRSSKPKADPAKPVDQFQLTETSSDAADAPRKVALKNVSADFTADKFPSGYAVAEIAGAKNGRTPSPTPGTYRVMVFETSRGIGSKSGTTLTFTLSPEIIGSGRFRIMATTAGRPVAGSIPPAAIQRIVNTPEDERTPQRRKEIATYYRSVAPLLDATRRKLAAVRKEIDEYPKTSLVMRELPEPRETHIHVRGAFLSLGEKVTPAVPSLFGQTLTAARATRLDLARWLVSDENPLTARVTVNRIWEQFFGAGIVATSEDLGTQGEAPTNQPLLDWLACEFMHPVNGSKNWDLKAVYKLIAMSAAYQQSAGVSPEILEKDPYNRLLSRGPRFRLPAELIRDQALAVSGLLSDKMGGPSVFPMQPDGIWHSPYSGDKWVTSPGPDKYRRGIYTFLRRSAPYPEFMAFDMTTHEAICTRRSRTNTALQALTTLNDPAFVQPAAALARKILAEGGEGKTDRVKFAFGAVLVRSPGPSEVFRLSSLYDRMLEKYRADPKAAVALATSGLSSAPDHDKAPELAAWTVVSNVLLNLDETLTKE